MAYRRTLLQELKTLLHVESILTFSSLVILIINGCRHNRIRKYWYCSRIFTGKHHITKFNNRFYKVLKNVNIIATNPQPPVRQMVATLTTGPTPAWMTTVCQMVDDRLSLFPYRRHENHPYPKQNFFLKGATYEKGYPPFSRV